MCRNFVQFSFHILFGFVFTAVSGNNHSINYKVPQVRAWAQTHLHSSFYYSVSVGYFTAATPSMSCV